MSEINLKLGAGIALLAVFLVFGVSYSRASEQINQKFAADYRLAPNCTQSSAAVSSLEPCSYEAVQVAGKKAVSHKSGYTYSVNLLTAAGPQHQVKVFQSLYQSITPGSELTAQVWRGEIRSLSYQNEWYQTEQNPDIRIHDSDFGLYATFYITGAGMLCLAVVWYSQRRSLLNGLTPPVQTGSEYPFVRDDN